MEVAQYWKLQGVRVLLLLYKILGKTLLAIFKTPFLPFLMNFIGSNYLKFMWKKARIFPLRY
jgi:hypothetical protein